MHVLEPHPREKVDNDLGFSLFPFCIPLCCCSCFRGHSNQSFCLLNPWYLFLEKTGKCKYSLSSQGTLEFPQQSIIQLAASLVPTIHFVHLILWAGEVQEPSLDVVPFWVDASTWPWKGNRNRQRWVPGFYLPPQLINNYWVLCARHWVRCWGWSHTEDRPSLCSYGVSNKWAENSSLMGWYVDWDQNEVTVGTISCWGKAYQSEGKASTKTPSRVSCMCLKNYSKASVQQKAGVECAEQSEVGDEMGEMAQTGPCGPLWEFQVWFQVRWESMGRFYAGRWHNLVGVLTGSLWVLDWEYTPGGERILALHLSWTICLSQALSSVLWGPARTLYYSSALPAPSHS